MTQLAQNFIDFARRSPTAFHAAEAICAALRESGFTALNEREPWSLVPGGKYFVTRNRSAVIALTIPASGMTHFQIVASHGDSPAFKLKPAAEETVLGHYVRLNTEKYGGMMMSTWLDRPLSIAGRLLVRDGGGVSTRLVDLDRDAALIPNLPIHFNREVNDGYKFNAQTDMLPVFGDETAAGRLAEELAALAGAKVESIVGSDLFLYDRTPGRVWGPSGEFFSCGHIDDLECAYTSLQAFLAAENARQINVLAVFDNEEVGSGTKQGADSTFLGDVLARAAAALGAADAQFRAAAACSFMVSAENAHAYRSEPSRKIRRGQPRLSERRRGRQAQREPEIHHRRRVRGHLRHDLRRGGRADAAFRQPLGRRRRLHAGQHRQRPRLHEHGGHRPGELAMHSVYETAGTKDAEYMVAALKKFYETEIVMESDGSYRLK